MATFINEQSEEDFGSAMFSYTSHTMGKQEERKKSDRKTGKERRKGEKTLRYGAYAEKAEQEMPSINTIWCIGRAGHWGTPMLDDWGCLSIDNFCADCKHTEEKHEKWLKSPDGLAWEEEQDVLDRLKYSSMEWEDDMLDMMEFYWEQWERNEQKRLRFEAMERLLRELDAEAAEKAAAEDPFDDYIPEIDDNFDD
jgi:hypothetical protein